MTLLVWLRNHSSREIYPSGVIYPSDVIYPGGERRSLGVPRIPIEVLRLWLAYYSAAWLTAIAISPDSPDADGALAALFALLIACCAEH